MWCKTANIIRGDSEAGVVTRAAVSFGFEMAWISAVSPFFKCCFRVWTTRRAVSTFQFLIINREWTKFTRAKQEKYGEGEKRKRQSLPLLSSRGGDFCGGSPCNYVPPTGFSGSADWSLGWSCVGIAVCVVWGGTVPGDTCQCWSEIVLGEYVRWSWNKTLPPTYTSWLALLWDTALTCISLGFCSCCHLLGRGEQLTIVWRPFMRRLWRKHWMQIAVSPVTAGISPVGDAKVAGGQWLSCPEIFPQKWDQGFGAVAEARSRLKLWPLYCRKMTELAGWLWACPELPCFCLLALRLCRAQAGQGVKSLVSAWFLSHAELSVLLMFRGEHGGQIHLCNTGICMCLGVFAFVQVY